MVILIQVPRNARATAQKGCNVFNGIFPIWLYGYKTNCNDELTQGIWVSACCPYVQHCLARNNETQVLSLHERLHMNPV